MLSEPNINSPANVDAGIQFRDKPEEYKKKVRKLIDKALENLWHYCYYIKKNATYIHSSIYNYIQINWVYVIKVLKIFNFLSMYNNYVSFS